MSIRNEKPPTVSSRQLKNWLEQGRGTGSGAAYKPWHTTENIDTPSHSGEYLCLLSNRVRYFLSEGEEGLVYGVLRDKDVTDARENVALATDLTERICQGFGIRHPTYGGPDEVLMPFTTDLLVTRRAAPIFVALSFKKRKAISNAKHCASLFVEHAYWSLHQVPYLVATELEVTDNAVGSLRFLRPEQRDKPVEPGTYEEFLRRARAADWSGPLLHTVRTISRVMNIKSDLGLQVFKSLVWDGRLECDLERKVHAQLRNAVSR